MKPVTREECDMLEALAFDEWGMDAHRLLASYREAMECLRHMTAIASEMPRPAVQCNLCDSTNALLSAYEGGETC